MTEQAYTLSTGAAEFYESTFVPALFRDWAGRLTDFAGVAPGQAVLDVACGTGIVARTAADRVGPDGTVVGVDVNEAMLSVARRLAPDLRWEQGDAAALPCDDDSFDLVLCQAALMFFPDRAAALREMARAARPDGRVALHVPGRLSHSPGYVALTDVAARHAGPDVRELLGSYFAVGDPDLIHHLADAAGLAIDEFTSWIGATRLPSVDEFLDVELLPLADRVDPSTRVRILDECREALAPFLSTDGAIAAPIEAHLVLAHRR